MNAENSVKVPENCSSRSSIRNLCSEVLSELKDSFGLSPNQLGRRIDQIENKVVKIRNCIIDQYRKEGRPPEKSVWRKPLDRINLALTLIASVEYPATGLHRSYLKDAEKVLEDFQGILRDEFSSGPESIGYKTRYD